MGGDFGKASHQIGDVLRFVARGNGNPHAPFSGATDDLATPQRIGRNLCVDSTSDVRFRSLDSF
jgi:hypothetical protein